MKIKYRVEQIKEEVKRRYMPAGVEEQFYPQYKKFLKWKNFKTWHKGVKWAYIEDVKFDSLKDAMEYIETVIPKKSTKDEKTLPKQEPVHYFMN